MDRRTYDDALNDLGLIVARLTQRIDGLGDTKANRQRRARLTVERNVLAAALDELRNDEAADEDTADVSAAVLDLATHLERLAAPGWPPTALHAGSDSGRQGRGDPGHCWVCAVVGHAVAHPQRGCADVGCTVDHSEPDDEPGTTIEWVTPGSAAAAISDPSEGLVDFPGLPVTS